MLALGSALSLSVSPPARAEILDQEAVSVYTVDVAASLPSIQANATYNVSGYDNLTCGVPIPGGSQINPRVQYVLGEVYANDVVFGEWDCASRTGANFSISGTIYDMAWSPALRRYTSAGSAPQTMTSIAGAAAVTPYKMNAFPGGHWALNQLHYARFVGTTSTGRAIDVRGQLFTVASN